MPEQSHPLDTVTSPEQREAELRAALRLGRLGSWTWHAATDTTAWSEQLYRIFGVDQGQPPPSFAVHSQLFMPESWPVLQAAVARTLQTGEPYCIALAYRRQDHGDGGWIESCGEAIRDAHGAIVGLRGTAHEISQRRRAEEAELEARLRAQAARDRAQSLRGFSQSIRTALNAVVGFAHMLKDNVGEDGAQARWVAQILAASQQIVALLEQLEALDCAVGDDATASPASPPHAAGDASLLPVDRLETLLDLVPCPMLIHNRGGDILHVSKALIDITGYTRDELPTRSAWAKRAYRVDDAADISTRLAGAFVTRCVVDGGERWVTTKTGARRRWHLFAAPASTAHDGEPLFVSLGIDITSREDATTPA